ncbi:MAG: MFS transporter [Pseudomonadota bacterium]
MATSNVKNWLVLVLVMSCTILALAGTDLVLPAVPSLPQALGGTLSQSQLVLAAFVAGAGVGLILFGALGASFDQRNLLIIALISYGLACAAALLVSSLDQLIALRFAQGLASSAPAVFAPGIIRNMFDEQGAMRAIGLLSSIESLTPAFAPIAGVWLLAAFDWQASFSVIAVLAITQSVLVFCFRRHIPNVQSTTTGKSYAALLRNAAYLRQAFSQALTLGALLVFVFGAPAVITQTMGGTLQHFIAMQISGIATFIVGANIAQRLVARFDAEAVIMFGSVLSLLGIAGITAYAFSGEPDPRMLPWLFVPMNSGLGLRSPPGFLQALVAADGDDARGAALLLLFVLLITGAGTAMVAPFIEVGLLALASASLLLSALSIVCLLALKPFARGAGPRSAAAEETDE